jgi:hypothetical protein
MCDSFKETRSQSHYSSTMSKNNYKAKWLSAINNSSHTLSDTYQVAEQEITEANAAHVNTSLTLKRVRNPLTEAAANARVLLDLMDECRTIGDYEFAPTTLPIDGKLAMMDMITIARRVRDTLKLATARVGIMSVALDEAYETIRKYESTISTMKPFVEQTAVTVTELFVVGAGPTERELLDVERAYADGAGEYMRFGETYDDLGDDEFELTPLVDGSTLRAPRSELLAGVLMTSRPRQNFTDTESDEDDESEDDKGDSAASKHTRRDSAVVIAHQRNRSAQIIPTAGRTLAQELDL